MVKNSLCTDQARTPEELIPAIAACLLCVCGKDVV